MDTRSLGLLYRDKRGKRGEVGEKRRETGTMYRSADKMY